MAPQNILITGASRGLGLNLAKALVLRPNTTLIAAVRSVANATPVLKALPVGANSKIIIVKIDSTSSTDAAAAAKELETTYHITHIDILFANAGTFVEDSLSPVASIPIESFRTHFEVNTIAPIVLFQAFKPLLDASASPRFFVMSSILGSIGVLDKVAAMPIGSYGVSKSAVNYLVRRVSLENPKIIAIAFHPGWVQTEMGNAGAKNSGMEEAPLSIEDSIKGLLRLIDEASLEQSGKLIAVEEGVLPY